MNKANQSFFFAAFSLSEIQKCKSAGSSNAKVLYFAGWILMKGKAADTNGRRDSVNKMLNEVLYKVIFSLL